MINNSPIQSTATTLSTESCWLLFDRVTTYHEPFSYTSETHL